MFKIHVLQPWQHQQRHNPVLLAAKDKGKAAVSLEEAEEEEEEDDKQLETPSCQNNHN